MAKTWQPTGSAKHPRAHRREDPRRAALRAIGRPPSRLLAALFLTSSFAGASAQELYPGETYPYGGAPRLHDVDGDGLVDLVGASGASVFVALGSGDGGFGIPAYFPVAGTVLSIALGDFDGDGRIDVIAACLPSRVSVILNRTAAPGSPDFSAPSDVPVVSAPHSVAVGHFDLESNAFLDAAVVNQDANSVTILLGNGAGGLSALPPLAVGSKPVDLVLTDCDGDGRLDVATANQNSGDVSILRNTGFGSFTALPPVPAGTLPQCIAAGQFDSGGLDLVVGNWTGISVLQNAGGCAYNRTDVATPGIPRHLVVHDVDLDGKLDLVVQSNTISASLMVLIGDGQGSFALDRSLALGGTQVWQVPSVAVGPIDAGLRPDVALAVNGGIAVLLDDPAGGWISPRNHPLGGGAARQVLLEDVDADGDVDLVSVVTPSGSNGNVEVSLGDGTGGFSAPVWTSVSFSQFARASLGRMNAADPHLDLVVVDSPFVYVHLGNGSGGFSSPVQFPAFGPTWTALALAEMTFDDRPDVVLAGGDRVAILPGQADGGLGTAIVISFAGRNFFRALPAHMNADGFMDLVLTGTDGRITILLGDGQGGLTLGGEAQVTGAAFPRHAVVDFDGDGLLDVATTVSSTVRILFGDGLGGFAPLAGVVELSGFATLQDLLSADLNGDGYADLVVADFHLSRIGVLLGVGKGSFAVPRFFSVAARPVSLSSGDLNGDGRIDLVSAVADVSLATIHLNRLPPSPFFASCFGDGTGSSCGCGNESAPGSGRGCLNGLGVGARLSATGTSSIAADDLVLLSEGVPAQPGLFFQGNALLGGGSGVTFGDGLRCCGQGVVRLQVVVAQPPEPASASTTVSIAQHPPPGTIEPGLTKCYQHWYRNPGSSVCGTGFNLSNAVLVTWVP